MSPVVPVAIVPLLAEVTHHMALLPLLWLIVLAYYGQRRSAAAWGIGLVLGVSWLADTLAHWVDPWLVSTIYPLVQAILLAVVLLPLPAARRFVGTVLTVGGLTLLIRGVERPDTIIHTIAWVGMVLMVWRHCGRLRLAVLSSFGLGWLGYLGYAVAPSFPTWGVYQAIRAVGLGVFCWATAPVRFSVRVAV